MRINKYLAMCNLGSRRDTEELVLKKKIAVNNVICTDLATDIKVGFDEVTFEGRVVTPVEEKIYIALNKPKGYIVTKRDEYNRQTVFDLLPKFEADLFAVGRLDKDSEGLLLLTNDGDFANTLMHPRFRLSKIYKVEVAGRIKPRDLHELQEGVFVDGEKTLPARVFIKKSDNDSTVLRFTIYQGKNRQIRKMLETIGYKVISLKRLQIGGIKLQNLPLGAYRPLSQREIKSILSEADRKKEYRDARKIDSFENRKERKPEQSRNTKRFDDREKRGSKDNFPKRERFSSRDGRKEPKSRSSNK